MVHTYSFNQGETANIFAHVNPSQTVLADFDVEAEDGAAEDVGEPGEPGLLVMQRRFGQPEVVPV